MITLLLEGPADAGQCVAHHDGRVVFVTGGLPGERVEVDLDDADATVLKGTVRGVLDASPMRVPDRREAWTDHAGELGGVEYAHADDAYARSLKFQAVAEHFRRIARLDVAEFTSETSALEPLSHEVGAGSPTQEAWRTRVQFAVDAQGRAAAHRPRSHTLVPLRRLPLASPGIEALSLTDLDFSGVERVEVALPASGGPGAVLLRGASPAPEELVSALRERGLSVLEAWGRQPRGRGRRPAKGGRNRGGATAAGTRLREGDWFLHEVPEAGTRFRVRGDGFWQVHPQAPTLLGTAMMRAIKPRAGERVADLYSGAGLLSARLAAAGADVVGIEGSASAVEDARVNVPAARFVAGRVESELARVPHVEGVVLDPPRAGAGRAVTDAIVAGDAARIAYVSCDSATMARDIQRLGEGGFTVRSLEVFDLFPLTGHVELVAALER